ncbi:proton pump-interactor 1-like isoform X2 [Abrus precatorius]|uniref:Proton pump-interactor 1-like isoform X2 n=1 Tax=Abrus precatorius TaxID=3816 RepID=A0A8B8LEA7_ABRPR|nr:proton pump-interactor 1-like isoform X2 [Abrus precatorius]
MAVEVVGFEMVEGPVDNNAEGDKSVSQENVSEKLEQDAGVAEPIKFGSHGDESAKEEGNVVSDSNAPKDVPKDAVEEWPAPKQIHSFYFVRFRPYDDPNIKAKLNKLDKEISQKNQVRIKLTESIRAKRSERAELISQIKALRDDNRQFQNIVDEKIKEIGPLQEALGKLRTANNAGRGGLCSSEEELDNIIYSLQYRIQHESIPLAEEKQILREIKQLEGTREKVIANAAMRAKVQDSMGQKEALQDQLIGVDLDGVKKERQVVRSKIKQLDDALKAIDKDIQSLQEELGAVTQKREKAYESIQQLRKQRDEGNSHFYQSRAILTKARELAANKDINALEELSQGEVERVMSLWSSDKSFRNDYEKRILPSLDMRQLSRDGRMRNPDERPLLEELKPAETDALPKTTVKQPKEEPKSSLHEAVPTQKVQKETKKKGRDLKPNLDVKDLEDAEDYDYERPKETPVKEPAIDPEKLKEMKREEEIAKQKQAMERKKKQAEKAAAKAAIRAQKEAEKKLKEREKKAKKAAAGPNPEEPENEVEEVVTEQEKKTNGNAEALAPVKEKVQKESSIRSRGRAKATKGPESIPKAILKRKRSNNYWVWIASCVVLVLALLVLGYTLLF